ncbi:MAG: DegV family protein [Eubacterium sp.]|nr:DegV family protein [Eubacterium sp.]
MGKVAIVTDSNSGITQAEAYRIGIFVLPMPFYIDEKMYYDEIDLTYDEFFEKLKSGADVKTSMPALGSVTDLWQKVLREYDEIVHIPMSSSLSGSYETACMLAKDYDGKVHVVDNQRISVTQRQAVYDAKQLADEGKSAAEIADILMKEKSNSSIYIMVDTLRYLRRGGRITAAAAALGTFLKIKPILQIQGEKLDAYAQARTAKQAKTIMLEAMKKDFEERFHDASGANMHLEIAYTHNLEAAEQFKEEVAEIFPNHDITINPLSISVACHIGAGALALACSHKVGAAL